MAQEPTSKELLDAVKQQESGGRRYKEDGKTLLEGPQTKYGTAKGEMQVLDMTNKDPGYGVKPARDESPDERARVGRDYLAAMVKKYGDKETALVAYNWGPGNTDKWLKKGGDFSKLPAETQNYVAKITGSLGSTKIAQATPTKQKSGLQRAVYKAAPLTHPMLSQLGPSYQAAMAVSMLADEGEKEGKSEYEPSEAEKMLTETAARPVALAQADLSYQSPFPQQAPPAPQPQPQQFAVGGTVVSPAAGKTSADRKFLDEMKGYNSAAKKYQNDAVSYYGLLRDERGNPVIGAMMAGAPAGAYNVSFYNDPTNSLHALTGLSGYDQPMYQADAKKFHLTGITSEPAETVDPRLEAAKAWAKTRNVDPNLIGYFKQNVESISPFNQLAYVNRFHYNKGQDWGTQMAAPADLATPVNPVTGKAYTTDEATARKESIQKNMANRQVALNVAQDPASFGLSMNKIFNQGGMVHRAEGSPETGERMEDPQMMADKTTELQGFTTRQPDGTGTLWGPNVPVSRSAKELKAYTEAMNPAVKTFTGGLGMGTRGYIYADQPDIINLNTALSPGEREVTMLHELEHSMDARGGDIYGRPNFAKMGGMDNNHRAYTLMGNRWDSVEDTVKNMVDNREKLEKFFGRPLDNSYFRKDSYDNLNKVGKTKAMFSEQLASLSALEQTTGKFLTQDPEMRELFPNTKMMAVYDALTGPRQTRMDARDLPPHTPVPSYTYQQNPALRFIQKTLTGENEYGPSSRPIPIKRAGGSPETGEVGYFQDPFGVPDSGPVTADTLSKGKEFKAADALKAVKEVGKGAARNLKNILQGVSETPYNLVGGPADIGNMALTPFGLGSAEPTLGSAHLKRLALEKGIRQAPPTDPRDQGFYTMGELGASVVNPGPIAAKVGQTAEKAVTTGGKAVAKEMLRGMEGKGVLAPISPQDSIMYAVKQRGGAFTGSRDIPVQGQFVDDVTWLTRSGDLFPDTRRDLNISIQAREALNDWTESKIGSYIRRDMATEGDPFVKATDQGKKLHLHEGIDDIPSMDLEYRRRIAGMPKEGFAKTELGKKVESQIDSSIFPETLGDTSLSKMHPSLTGLRETDPNQPIYELGPRLSDRMQFPKLLEGMEDMLAQRNYKAYGEFSSPIPEQYHLTPEKLQGLSPVQASEKVALFNQWKDGERQIQAGKYLERYGNIYKKYDNGRKWIAMDDLAEEPMQAELVQQAGCLGGWCTAEKNWAMTEGSGNKRLHMLFDEKATPRVQLTVTKSTPTTDDFMVSEFSSSEDVARFENKYGNLNYISREQIEATPEYQAWARTQGSPERITEIKGQFNRPELAKDPNSRKYLKEVQDFVKSKDWGTVANLDGINMIDLDDYLPPIARGLNLEQTNQLSDFMKSLNGGSRYADKYEGENIVREASLRVFQPFTPPGRATGGMVERQPSTARYI